MFDTTGNQDLIKFKCLETLEGGCGKIHASDEIVLTPDPEAPEGFRYSICPKASEIRVMESMPDFARGFEVSDSSRAWFEEFKNRRGPGYDPDLYRRVLVGCSRGQFAEFVAQYATEVNKNSGYSEMADFASIEDSQFAEEISEYRTRDFRDEDASNPINQFRNVRILYIWISAHGKNFAGRNSIFSSLTKILQSGSVPRIDQKSKFTVIGFDVNRKLPDGTKDQNFALFRTLSNRAEHVRPPSNLKESIPAGPAAKPFKMKDFQPNKFGGSCVSCRKKLVVGEPVGFLIQADGKSVRICKSCKIEN